MKNSYTSTSAAIIYSLVQISDRYSKKIQSIHVIICELLMNITALPNDICENILLYLSFEDQYQFIIFNPITIDNQYSIIQFILLIINNICHFSLILFIIIYFERVLGTLGPKFPLIIGTFVIEILSFTEMGIIFYFYRRNYKIFICYESTQEILQVVSEITGSFTNEIDCILHLCIYIPLTCIVLFVLNPNINTNYTLPINIIFFISYFITTMYECYMHYRQYILEKELIQISRNARMTTHISVLIYLQINAVILLSYSLIYSVLPIFIVSLLYIYFRIFQKYCNCWHMTDIDIEGKAVINLFLMYADSVCIATLSWQLWNENQNNNIINSLQIISVIITVLNMTAINVCTFYYFDNQLIINTNDEKEKVYINKFLWAHDICVILPTLIMLFYYSIDSVSIPSSVYSTLIIIGLHEFYRIMYAIAVFSYAEYIDIIIFMIKFGIVMPVLGFMYIFDGGLSYLFLIIGATVWGLFLSLAFGICFSKVVVCIFAVIEHNF
eukprot:310196_1